MDELQPSPKCVLGICDGSGFVFLSDSSMPVNCKCLRVKDRTETRRRYLGERFYNVRLEDIAPLTDKQKRLKFFLLQNPSKSIFLSGAGGAGKTHFLASMYNYWDDRDQRVKYLDDGMLKDELRQAELDGDYTFIRELLRDYKYIFFDDLNKEKASDFYRSALYRLFNEMYKNHRYVFITANEPLKILGHGEYWGPSVTRRVEDLCEIVEF